KPKSAGRDQLDLDLCCAAHSIGGAQQGDHLSCRPKNGHRIIEGRPAVATLAGRIDAEALVPIGQIDDDAEGRSGELHECRGIKAAVEDGGFTSALPERTDNRKMIALARQGMSENRMKKIAPGDRSAEARIMCGNFSKR